MMDKEKGEAGLQGLALLLFICQSLFATPIICYNIYIEFIAWRWPTCIIDIGHMTIGGVMSVLSSQSSNFPLTKS